MCRCVQDRRLPSPTAAQTKKSIPGTVDIPFPLQQPPKPAAELGSTWMEVAELCPTAALPWHKSSREEQDEQRFVGCTRRRAPGTALASPHARLLRQAARGGLGWLKHRTALGLAPSGSLLGSGSAGRRGSGCSEPSVVQHGGAASLLLAPWVMLLPRDPGEAAPNPCRRRQPHWGKTLLVPCPKHSVSTK